MNNEQHTKRNHYVPQFYLRQFAADQDENKLFALSHHDPFISGGLKSISRIGYEEDLYTFERRKEFGSVEGDIGRHIETPLASSAAWKKIVAGNPDALDESDKLSLYLLIRHLQFRNIANLKFIENEAEYIKAAGFRDDYSDEEKELFSEITRTASGPHSYFLSMASTLRPFSLRWREASIQILRSKIPLRSSTNPALSVPRRMGHIDIYDQLEKEACLTWLPLSREFGALLILTHRFFNFGHDELPDDAAKLLNRLYLVQLAGDKSARHCIADDPYIENDMEWAGFDSVGSNGARRFQRRIRVRTT